MRSESRAPTIAIDAKTAAHESSNNRCNVALACLLADLGALRNPPERVLANYTRQCAIAASCAQLARATLFLARHGRRCDGTRILTESHTRRLNASMLLGGMDGSMAEVSYRVGLPAKSGGGGVVAVVPGHGTICAWSPGLDEAGNSVAGMAALEAFTTASGLSIF